MLINSHSGNDYFTSPMVDEFFQAAVEIQERTCMGPYPALHSSHRPAVPRDSPCAHPVLAVDHPRHPGSPPQAALCGRHQVWAPWISSAPRSHNCSHWTNVAEAHPNHPELLKVVEAIAPRVLHIHARVGYEEGPQVPDPRAPEWLGYTTAFEHMWKLMWTAQVS